MDQALGEAEGREQRLQGVGDDRLADGSERERGEGHAELRRGEHQGDGVHGREHRPGLTGALLGQRLDLRAAGGDQRELRADEEAVHREQEHDGEEVQQAHLLLRGAGGSSVEVKASAPRRSVR